MSKLIPAIQKRLPVAVLVLTIAFYPLLGTFLASIGIVDTTPIAIGYRAIYLALSLLIILSFLPRVAVVRVPLVIPSFLVFWTLYVGRIVNDLVIEGISSGFTSKGVFFFLTYGLGGCLVPAIAVSLVASTLNFKRLQKVLLLFFTFCNLAIFLFLLKENGVSVEIFYTRLRVADSVVSPIAVSQYGGALFVSAIGAWLILQKKNWLLLVGMALGMGLMIIGSSRGPLAALALSVTLILIDHFRIRFKFVTYWLHFLLAAIAVLIFIVNVIVPNFKRISLISRVNSTLEEGAGLDAREVQWSTAWAQFLESPVWGDAIVERALSFYPHNMILEILMSTGLLGVLALAPAAYVLIYKYINRWMYTPEQRITFYLFFFFFGCAMFSLALITITHVWVLWALSASLTVQQKRINE